MGIAEERNGNIKKCIEYYEKAQNVQFDSKLGKRIKLIKNKLKKWIKSHPIDIAIYPIYFSFDFMDSITYFYPIAIANIIIS